MDASGVEASTVSVSQPKLGMHGSWQWARQPWHRGQATAELENGLSCLDRQSEVEGGLQMVQTRKGDSAPNPRTTVWFGDVFPTLQIFFARGRGRKAGQRAEPNLTNHDDSICITLRSSGSAETLRAPRASRSTV